MKRVFSFDFIRMIATFIIILTHYNALFIYNVNRPELFVGSKDVFHIYIGDFGVSLFLILSGAALMYKYSYKDFKIKDFYMNRLKKILPFFWFAYILILSISLLKYGNVYIDRFGIPKSRYIFTLLGIDGYLSCLGYSTFYIIGEWFLGFILIYYLIFPVLYYCVTKFPKITIIVGLIIYITSLILFKNYAYSNLLIPVRIIELLFGMYFIKIKDKINYKVVIPCWLILLIAFIFQININNNVLVTIIGVCSFIVLYYIGAFLEKVNIIKNLSSFISSISYPCFIIHHWLIFEIISKVDLNTILPSTSYIIFGCCLFTIIVASYLLQKIYGVFNEKLFNNAL